MRECDLRRPGRRVRLERELLQWESVRPQPERDASIRLLWRGFLRSDLRWVHRERRLLPRRDLRHRQWRYERGLWTVQSDDDHDRSRFDDEHRNRW